jgi:protein-tyrosine phosphatase
VKHLLTPDAPFSFVADDLAIGGVMAYAETGTRFDLRINVAYELDPNTYLFPTTCHRNFKLDDTADPQLVLRQAPEVFRAVELVKEARLRGRRVLVTCAQGRNRSGIVAAEYLIQCGNKPADVVRKIQERRANALTNTLFVAWLHRPRAR